MKKTILSLFLICTSIIYAQRDANEFRGRKKSYECKDLIIINNELSGKYQVKLPNDFILSPINFSIVKTTDANVRILTFYIPYYPYSSSENGVYFKLKNDEILKFPNVKVDVNYRGPGYSLICSIIMDAGTIDKLKESFITEFSVGDKNIKIEERNYNNLSNLFTCMFANN